MYILKSSCRRKGGRAGGLTGKASHQEAVMAVTGVHLHSHIQNEPSAFFFLAVRVGPDPRAPHARPCFLWRIAEVPAHSAQQPRTTTTHSTQHSTLHTPHYTPATAMDAEREPSWGSFVAY